MVLAFWPAVKPQQSQVAALGFWAQMFDLQRPPPLQIQKRHPQGVPLQIESFNKVQRPN